VPAGVSATLSSRTRSHPAGCDPSRTRPAFGRSVCGGCSGAGGGPETDRGQGPSSRPRPGAAERVCAGTARRRRRRCSPAAVKHQWPAETNGAGASQGYVAGPGCNRGGHGSSPRGAGILVRPLPGASRDTGRQPVALPEAGAVPTRGAGSAPGAAGPGLRPIDWDRLCRVGWAAQPRGAVIVARPTWSTSGRPANERGRRHPRRRPVARRAVPPVHAARVRPPFYADPLRLPPRPSRKRMGPASSSTPAPREWAARVSSHPRARGAGHSIPTPAAGQLRPVTAPPPGPSAARSADTRFPAGAVSVGPACPARRRPVSKSPVHNGHVASTKISSATPQAARNNVQQTPRNTDHPNSARPRTANG
jgi:hypothetical protein